MLEQDLIEFGNRMGFHGLRLNKSGFLRLEIDTIGDFYIEHLENRHEVLFYLLKHFEFPSADLYWQALEMCHEQRGLSSVINPIALDESSVGFLIRETEDACNAVKMGQIADLLMKFIKQLSEKFR
jgi:type III secretion system chaperone SycN